MQRLDIDLGHRLVPYAEGRALQQEVHAQVVAGTRGPTLVMLEHESVYTVGRRAHSWERPAGAFVEPGHVPVVDVDRGGKTTWHGPGQLTVYPVVRLASPVDVIAYVRALEQAVIDVCEGIGLEVGRVEGRSGVWVTGPRPDHRGPDGPGGPPATAPARPERKVCALGVRVSRGVTTHGIGLNVCPDLAAFGLDRIVPCGIDDAAVTSLEAETGLGLRPLDLADDVATALAHRLGPLVADATCEPPAKPLGPGS